MKERKTGFVCVNLQPNELETLTRLAKQTDRSKGSVLRRLLGMAELPDAQRLLGNISLKEEKHHG